MLNEAIKMTIQTVTKLSCLTIIVVIILYINIFQSKDVLIIKSITASNRDVLATFNLSESKCLQNQHSRKEHIREYCSSTKV